MASVATEKRNGKTFYRVWWRDGHKERKSIRLRGVNRKAADAIAVKVGRLNSALISGCPLDPETSAWIAGLGDDLRLKLRQQGFARFVPEVVRATLADFTLEHINSRADWAHRTNVNTMTARTKLIAFLGENRDLRSISPQDGEAWKQWLATSGNDKGGPMAMATVSTNIKRAKYLFGVAVKQGLCDQNPFDEVTAGSQANDDRKQYIPRELVEQVISVCSDAQWKLIIALSRFGGLRCPSETLELKWSDINWESDRITVRSSKTGTRVIPLFGVLRPYLVDAFDAAEPGAIYCITKYRSSESNLRTQLHRLIRKAGIEVWGRAFHQMRGSCQTDLEQHHGLHTSAVWLGNSPKVAVKHYLSVPPAAFDAATEQKVVQGVVQRDAAEGCTTLKRRSQEDENCRELQGVATRDDTVQSNIVPRRGVEPLLPA